ncbi:hypothetical protein JQC67_02800 [Aurantibacter crassamenti]|uniref:hypothetical protein n=1 Tax=Aurantibacter crassamenti TaxID=1837375 RepID=UPI00193A0E6E|nr:hypothetical protein [Aurantibacter crassamenti]MBM1105059.1 hypothetical protein [Aurantibacter crassamenti]
MNSKSSNSSVLYAGAAQTNITPVKGTIIGVDFFSHYARFIHDSLFSKSLVFKQGQTVFAIILVDICIMPSDFLCLVKTKIENKVGIKKENVTLACTHTHGAGNVAGLLGGAVDIAYRSLLPDLIVTSVVDALKKLKPAKIASGSANLTGYQVCRRYLMKDSFKSKNPVSQQWDVIKTNPFGAEDQIVVPAASVDSEVCFLGVKGLDDSWISILGNYSSHYAGDWDVDTITADFYGTFAKHLSNNIGAQNDFVPIMSYGTGADVNTWDFLNPDKFPDKEFAKTEMMGKDLATVIYDEIEKLKWEENAELTIVYDELELNIRKPTKEELKFAANKLAANKFGSLEVNELGIEMVYAREQLLLNEYPEKHISAVQVVKIGNQLIGGLGGEIFTETGLWLKNKLQGHNYFTICLANTYDGYVPPAHELNNGGYETWRARSSFLDGKAENRIKNKLLELALNM